MQTLIKKLLLQETLQLLDLDSILPHVDDAQIPLHLLALAAVLHQDFAKNFVDGEELFFEDSADLLPLRLDDVAAPHANDFPLSEISEEVFGADL